MKPPPVSISCRDLTLRFPVYGVDAKSLKKHLAKITVGGRLVRHHGTTEVTALSSLNLELKAGLRDALAQLEGSASAEDIQNVVYEVGRREPFLDHKKKAKDGKPGVSLDWFNMLYQVLLGQEKGPRFGSFVAVYGLQNTIDMIDGALARSA